MIGPAGPDDDDLREACGVFGVYAPGPTVPQLTYLGLYALQHRGQESAGIAVSDGEKLTVVKDMGLVTRCSTSAASRRSRATSRSATAATRPPGRRTWRNAQPVYRSVGERRFALGHNGNLTNTDDARRRGSGCSPATVTSDSDLVAELIAAELEAEPATATSRRARAVAAVLPRLAGAFSLVLMDEARSFGVRDPHGFWPLVLGRAPTTAAGCSRRETAALDIVGAHFVREVEPGEMVVIDADGLRSLAPVRRAATRSSACSSSSTSPGPTPGSTARACTRPGSAHGRGARRAGAGRRRHGDAGARVGRPGGAGLRPPQRHPVRRRAGEEPLRRPHVHPAEPGACAAAACA